MNDTPHISHRYRVQNRELHEKPGYGSSGHLWLGHVLEICEAVEARSVLDYGAGKATLGRYITRYGLEYYPYDPATFPARPVGKSDVVVCLDVLEHIEPDRIGKVLQDLQEHTGKVVFLRVCTRESTKTLSDGRNAHLLVHPWVWWKTRLKAFFKPLRIRMDGDFFELVAEPLPAELPAHYRATLRGQ